MLLCIQKLINPKNIEDLRGKFKKLYRLKYRVFHKKTK
jgi:N-acyl-L-homoserine lactone synthetase